MTMSELDKIRENINSIDEQMAQLFQERMEMSQQVAAFKKDRGLSIRDAERERELIDRDRRFIKDPAVDGYYVQFLRSILDLSCAYQSRLLNGMKVAYSGVEGAYGYIAARRMFPEAQLIAYPDFAAAHRAVEQGEADSAVLPLENSYAGEVGAVMDLLFSGELYINQVLDLEIDHSLLGVEGAAPDTVRTGEDRGQPPPGAAPVRRLHQAPRLRHGDVLQHGIGGGACARRQRPRAGRHRVGGGGGGRT